MRAWKVLRSLDQKQFRGTVFVDIVQTTATTHVCDDLSHNYMKHSVSFLESWPKLVFILVTQVWIKI